MGTASAGSGCGVSIGAKFTAFEGRLGQPVKRDVVRRSLSVAGAYFVVATTWVVASSQLAAREVNNVDSLQRIETIKGVIFMVVSSLVVYGASHVMLARAERAARELEVQRSIIEAKERQAVAGMMAATIAHDANNVLTALLGELDLIDRRGEARQDSMAIARAASQRLVELHRRLLNAARHRTEEDLCELDVASAVDDLVNELRAHRSLKAAKVKVISPANVPVRASPVLLHQALTNLVVNAGEAAAGADANGVGTPAGRQVEVRVVDGSKAVTIEVHDNGSGVPQEQREGIFSALKTTKETGSGLGLYSVRACVAAMDGTVEVGDSPLGGALFRIALPKRSSPRA